MLAEMRELLAQQVERIRARGASDESWLAQLLALEDGSDDPAVRERRFSRAITIQAGTGTVAGQLKWCCYHLLQHPEALGRARVHRPTSRQSARSRRESIRQFRFSRAEW
jgi:cytochrome P450